MSGTALRILEALQIDRYLLAATEAACPNNYKREGYSLNERTTTIAIVDDDPAVRHGISGLAEILGVYRRRLFIGGRVPELWPGEGYFVCHYRRPDARDERHRVAGSAHCRWS